jgi:glycosyltransferase involved in cell wall biosynthesis
MDKKRKTIGLIFTGGDNWIGGLYYIVNIVKGLQFLPTKQQPKIVLIYNSKTPKEMVKECSFPNIRLVNIDRVFIARRLIYSMLFRIFKKNYLFRFLVQKNKIDVLYPFNEYHTDLEFLNCDIYYWIFDFQHKFLPELFSKDEIIRRDNEFRLMAEKANNIVVSGLTAQKHFQQFYPNYFGNIHVLSFASIFNIERLPSQDFLVKKYNIKSEYFLVSNQFWIHKNHWVVLKAVKKLKDSGHTCLIFFTGKEYEPRNPNYVKDLKNFIDENGLNDFVQFLGFIPREDQLGLMKHCKAVIQPSKFEGWGTVVEDAKTLNIPIILSDIEVHWEQYPQGLFFDEDDEIALADLLINFSNQNPVRIQRNTRSFALKIKEIFLNELG